MAIRERWLTRKLVLGALVVGFIASWGGCTTINSIFSPPPAPTVPVAPPAPVPPKKEPVVPAPAPTKKEPEPPQPPKKEPEAPATKKEAPPPPTKTPPPPAPAPPVKKEPVVPAPAPTKKEPEPPQPPKKEPEAPPEKPEKKDSEAPPPVLAPQVGKGDEAQLRRTTYSRIQRAEQLVGQLEGKSLTGEQQERLMTVRSLLGSAREAVTAQDLTKASNLAEKARLLAEELSQVVK